MSLQVAVAAPFKQHGARTLSESEFVVALSLDRDWYSPDQAKRLVDVATAQGALARDGEDGDLRATFDPTSVTVPDGFVPDEELLQERSPFERVLDDLVADGMEKQEAVAGVNALQQELAVSIEAAAVVYARRRGLDVGDVARQALAGDE